MLDQSKQKTQLLSRDGQKPCFLFIFFKYTHDHFHKSTNKPWELNRIKFNWFPLLRTSQASRLLRIPTLY